MTYEMIISQIAQNLGWKSFESQLIKDIQFALYWSLMELSGDSGSLRNEHKQIITKACDKYLLPEDLQSPRSIHIRTISGEFLDASEVEKGELIKYVTSDSTDLNARYSDRIVYALNKVKSRVEIVIYPAIDGELYVIYDSIVNENLNIAPEQIPPIHRRFHMYLIDGATYYLARRELATIAKEKNPELLNVYLMLVKSHEDTFEKGKRAYAAFSMYRSTPPIAKAWNFYEFPEDY